MSSRRPFLIDPEWGFTTITWLSWIMIILGVLHLICFAIGEYKPSMWNWIKSEGFRKLFIGTSNRILFGWAGLGMILFGGVAIGLCQLFRIAFRF